MNPYHGLPVAWCSFTLDLSSSVNPVITFILGAILNSVESNSGLLLFFFFFFFYNLVRDWSREPAPLSQPIRCKTKLSRLSSPKPPLNALSRRVNVSSFSCPSRTYITYLCDRTLFQSTGLCFC